MTECKCETVVHLHGRAGQDYAKTHLVQVKVDDVNWVVLHRCPITGRYWKEYFPRSGEHGGGPPEFQQISEEEARREFCVT